jgi:hypothetical protein
MEKSKNVENPQDDIYTVTVRDNFEFETGKVTVDKSKDYCWTEKYFYNTDGLYIEEQASDFRQVDGVWFPFHLESTMYLPENEWTDKNKIRRKTVTDISSVEIDPQMVLSEESMLKEEMEVVETYQSTDSYGVITTFYSMKPKR